MFCSGCGQAMTPGQTVCPQCGRPLAPPVPPVPNLEFQLNNYAGRIKALSVVWFVYGGLSLVLGIIGLTFANAFFARQFGPWGHGPWGPGPEQWGPEWFWPAILRFGWAMVRAPLRTCICSGLGPDGTRRVGPYRGDRGILPVSVEDSHWNRPRHLDARHAPRLSQLHALRAIVVSVPQKDLRPRKDPTTVPWSLSLSSGH